MGVIPQVLNSGCGVQENGADIRSPSLLVLEPTENPESLFLYLHKGKGDKVESKYLTNLHIASHILNHTILNNPMMYYHYSYFTDEETEVRTG